MKGITRFTLYLPIAAMILTAALPFRRRHSNKYPSRVRCRAMTPTRAPPPRPYRLLRAARGWHRISVNSHSP